MHSLVGQHIAGRYRVEALLGSGGVGTVYSAIQEPLDRRVALKTLRPELSQNPAVRRRFVREARAVAALSHPNIAMVHDFGVAEGGQLYLAMELIEGQSMAELLGQQTPSFGVLRQLFDQILTALAHAHARGVVHRDVKPANVLISTDVDGNPHVKLVDFGIATVQRPEAGESEATEGATRQPSAPKGAAPADPASITRPADQTDQTDQTDAGRWAGTPHFMAPEQARGEAHLTGAVDVYSTGVMLYWAMSGRYPFQGATPMDVLIAHCRDEVPPLVYRSGLMAPEGLEALVKDALHKDPQRRIPGASVFRSRLRALSGAAEPEADEALEAPTPTTTRGAVAPPLAAMTQPTSLATRGGRSRTLFEGSRPEGGRLSDGSRPDGSRLSDGSRPKTMVEEGAWARPKTLFESGMVAALPPTPALGGAEGGVIARGVPPLIGRDDEREAITRAAQQVLASAQGMIVTLEGEAGVGKSRLARWAMEYLTEEQGFSAAIGAFLREGERGWRGVREAMDGALGTTDLSEGALRDRLAAVMEACGLTSAGDLGLMVGFLRPTDATRDERGSYRAQRLMALLVRVLEGLSKQRPLLLVINDLHWAGPETASFIEYLAHELTLRPARLLLIITLQLENHDSGPLIAEMLGEISHHHGTSVQRRALDPLNEGASRSLIAALLPASRELAQELLQRASGNPMHLVHLVRYLRDEDLIEPTPHGWRARQGVDMAEVLPPSLVDVLALRIAQLENQPIFGPRVRALLDRAAILGMRFRFSVLERMLAIENRPDLLENIDEDIDRILDDDLLRMTELPDDDLLTFPSGLVRDVLLGRLKGRRTQRKLHIHAAEAKIAVLGVSGADAVAVELLEHFAAGRDRRRELEYASRAADVAERSHRLSDALRHIDRALRLLEEHAADVPLTDQAAARRPLLLRQARLAMIQGQYTRAAGGFGEVEADPGASDEERIRATYGKAKLARTRGLFADASEHFSRGVALARTIRRPALLAYGLMGLADVQMQRGLPDEATELLDQARPVADAAQSPSMLAKIAWYEGELARASGDVDAAERHFRDALTRYQALDHRRGAADCLAKLAVVARMRADFDRAVEHYQAALRHYKSLGQRREVGHQYNGLGDIARYRHDLPLASEHYRRAVDIFQALTLNLDAALALTNLGLVALASSRFLEAEDALRRALKNVRRLDASPYLLIGITLNLAQLLTQTHRVDEALPLLDEGCALLQNTQLVDPDYARPLEAIADHLSADPSAHPRALALYHLAISQWQELGRTDDLRRATARLEAISAP
jgi:serine/threonine protein kinase/tetratricopeptide (TPR) repeat protein